MVSLLLVANLIFTGILLNHSAELKLAQRYVTWGYLLDWYGFQPIERAARFVARPGTFTQLQ
ncbi:MAG TPA: peptidase, partial [Gammaproteobacteria bacterium]|nr:peptidase [Gammaproteobacteria bacterium]